MPLLRVSSKRSSKAPLTGQEKLSSSPSAWLAPGLTLSLALPFKARGLTRESAAGAGSGVTVTPGLTTTGSLPGGATRRTWPTSIRFGFSRAFQRARSRGLWP